MAEQPVDTYLKNKIMTANPEQLRLMLYDGAIKFCRQASHATAQADHEAMYHALLRAQKIVLELMNSLNHKVDPDLCDKLTALYSYVYRRLVDASLERDAEAIDECLKLIEYERQTWLMLIAKLHKTRASGDESTVEETVEIERVSVSEPLATIGPANRPALPAPGADGSARPSISIEG
jgi:flagellar protein FliS